MSEFKLEINFSLTSKLIENDSGSCKNILNNIFSYLYYSRYYIILKRLLGYKFNDLNITKKNK